MARVRALDALRGILALVVVADHVMWILGSTALVEAARWAVIAFFVMSGYVLARSYDGAPLAFVVRRLVRLWPVYAVCILAGHLLIRTMPIAGEFLWWPSVLTADPPADPPAWTLYLEAWATFFLPTLFWLGSKGRIIALMLSPASLAFTLIDPRLWFVALFAAGSAAAQFNIPWPSRIPAPAVWLGKISYSLYLSHWICIGACVAALGPFGAALGVALTFPVAWCVWRWIEMPSIKLSRLAGNLVTARQPATPSA